MQHWSRAAHNYLQLSRSIAVTRAFLKLILSRVVRKISWRMAPAFRDACVSFCPIRAQSVRSLQVQAIYDSLAVFSCCLPWLGYGEMLFQRMLVLKKCSGYARIQIHCLLRLVAWTLCLGFATVAETLAHQHSELRISRPMRHSFWLCSPRCYARRVRLPA